MRQRAVVVIVAQLVEWSVVQIQSLAKFYIGHLFVYCQLYWKDDNKEKKRPRIAHLKKPNDTDRQRKIEGQNKSRRCMPTFDPFEIKVDVFDEMFAATSSATTFCEIWTSSKEISESQKKERKRQKLRITRPGLVLGLRLDINQKCTTEV